MNAPPKKRRFGPLAALGLVLAIVILLFGAALKSNNSSGWVPLARPDDRAALGGLGFSLLLEREGLRVQRQREPLKAMPSAKLWILLDPRARFSTAEAKSLLDWVKKGNTLIWAAASDGDRAIVDKRVRGASADFLAKKLGVRIERPAFFTGKLGLPLPPLSPLDPGAATIYRSGVKKASGSGDVLEIAPGHERIAGNTVGAQLARIPWGTGRIFVAPDALSWTNMALADGDTAILAMNIVRAHARRGDVAIWDERSHNDSSEVEPTPNILYWLWQPPLRFAVLQVLAALLLLGLFHGRRLGRAVPLERAPNALRASQWALAMSSLFQKVDRPHVAAQAVGEHFRRTLARRVGLSAGESDAVLAQRAVQVGGLDYEEVDRLLIRSRTPSSNPNEMLRDAQAMEIVLQKLSARR